jgi:hydroxymethylpyrimidine pyrophosphatase-like HAD family hydrolase
MKRLFQYQLLASHVHGFLASARTKPYDRSAIPAATCWGKVLRKGGWRNVVGMKLSVLALDYDGTFTRDDRPNPSVLAAVTDARRRKVTVILVTGRILDDLRRVAGDLRFVDAVVAENGAVIHFPGTGHTTVLAPPVPQSLVRRLADLGIPFSVGQCLVDAEADSAHRILDAIRELELPIVLSFNRSRVMAMAQGVSKATGLDAALTVLRASARNTVAIGDAENDHELLRFAEVGVAVEWGSRSLQAAADFVITGNDPSAVAGFIERTVAGGRLPIPARARRRLLIGHTEDNREFSLGVRGRNVLIVGETNSGKSWLAGLLCERLVLLGYSLCVIDPEGDYRTLDSLPGVRVLGGEEPPPAPRALLHALRYPDRSVVIDLSGLEHDAKREYIRSVLPVLNVIRRRTGTPHRIVVDEGHYFLRDAMRRGLLDLDFNGYTVVTYWPSQLPPELVAASEVILVTRESNGGEIEALRRQCDACGHLDASAWQMLPDLRIDQAVALPVTAEAGTELRTFVIGERLTPHVRHRQKYVDVPVSDDHAFVFDSGRRTMTIRAHTLREFVSVVGDLDETEAGGYLRRGDFSRWIGEVFGDHALARELEGYERKYPKEKHRQALERIVAAINSRYELTDATDVEIVHGIETAAT